MAKPAPLGKGVAQQPSNIKTEADFGKWLAHQNTETQDYYLFQNPDYTNENANGGARKQLNLIQQALEAERNEAFKKGDILPGVDESGQGTTLDNRGRAAALEAKGIRNIDEAAAGVSDQVGDYTVNPTMDPGAGYNLTDRLSYLGDQPLYEEKAIDQARTDTSGVDAQKYALGELKSNYAQGGLSAIDRARMAESQRIREAQARGAREGVRANAEEQGRAGGNLSFLLQSRANADANAGRARDDLETQALALQRKDAMLKGIGDVGGSIQTANDAIDHFNTQGQRDVQASNVGEMRGREHADVATKNVGAATQFATDTARSGANTDRANAGEFFNKGQQGGQRGLFRDKLAAAEAAAGQGNVAAGLASTSAGQVDTANANEEAAKMAFYGGIAQPFVDLATSAWNPKK